VDISIMTHRGVELLWTYKQCGMWVRIVSRLLTVVLEALADPEVAVVSSNLHRCIGVEGRPSAPFFPNADQAAAGNRRRTTTSPSAGRRAVVLRTAQ
jgi:hypothetical protein